MTLPIVASWRIAYKSATSGNVVGPRLESSTRHHILVWREATTIQGVVDYSRLLTRQHLGRSSRLAICEMGNYGKWEIMENTVGGNDDGNTPKCRSVHHSTCKITYKEQCTFRSVAVTIASNASSNKMLRKESNASNKLLCSCICCP
jgi:hypothetical protein